MTAAAESSGHSATHPGKAPWTSISTPTETMLAIPAQPSATRTARGGCRSGTARASSEPRANSHSRARVSK
jgi:hypothetical protein